MNNKIKKMTTRTSAKSRYARNSKITNLGTDEIIYITEPFNQKPKVYRRRKDITENASSEATTPNKRGIKKKKINNDSLEVIDIMENNYQKGGKNRSTQRKYSKVAYREVKKKEKGKNNSVDKIIKNNTNNRKERKIMSITLEETDEDDNEEEEEIKPTTSNSALRPSKRNPKTNQSRRYTSKTPDKRNKKRNNNNIQSYIQSKKKKKQKHPQNKITQYELSDNSDDDESNIEETQDQINSGFFSSRKTSQTKNREDPEEEIQKAKPKSTIKLSQDNSSALLGKKRKNEKNTKSKTPNKLNKNNIHVTNNEPIVINNSPMKIHAGKSSRTPVKNTNTKKADSGSNYLIDTKNYVTPELAILNQLIIEFGFEKVLDSLCKAKLNHKNKLDSCIQGLRDSCTSEKLPLFLIKMLFSYFDHKDKERPAEEKSQEISNVNEQQQEQEEDKEEDKIKENIKEEKDNEKEKIKEKDIEKEKENKKSVSMLKSCSTENTNTNNELNEPSEKPLSKSPIKSSSNPKLTPKNINNIAPMVIDEQITESIHLIDEEPIPVPKSPSTIKEKKVTQPPIPENKKVPKSPIKNQNAEPKKEKKNMSIGSHYYKDKDGMIYKYQVFKLDGKGNAIFKCYDDKCSSEGVYDLDSRIFHVTNKHSLKYNEHDYIINLDKNEDNVFKEMKNLEKNNAQVFKEGNERTVKIY